MSKRKKVSVIAANNRHAFKHYRHIVPILSGTGSVTKIGVISISGSAAGVAAGACYIAIDTAGTGTTINA